MNARDALYGAFSRHPLRRVVEGCPHCVSDEDQARLRAVPLHRLSAEQLDRYAFKAMTTWGEADDYRHFLPRILELACSDEGAAWPGLDPDLVARKMIDAGWRDWPADERAAVARFLDEHARLERGWLTPLETLGLDVAARLAAWRDGDDVAALVACAEFVIDNFDRPAVRAFARDPATAAAFEGAFLDDDGALDLDVAPLARAADLCRFA